MGRLTPVSGPGKAPIADGVFSMLVQADGRILVCARRWNDDHYHPNPPNDAVKSTLIRLLPDGHPDLEFAPSVADMEDFREYSSVVAAQADGKLIISARFGDRSILRILRLFPDGIVDPTFDFGNSSHSRPILQADGKIIASSTFYSDLGAASGGAARLLNDPATQSLIVPGATRVDWLRGGTTPETTQVWFELSTDGGTSWTQLGPETRCPGGWGWEGAGLPASGTVRARARTGFSGSTFNTVPNVSGLSASGLVELTLQYSLPAVSPDFSVAVVDGSILVTDNSGTGAH